MLPGSCNLALGGASWYLCVRGLSCTALKEWGLARGCPTCHRRRRLPAASKIGEGILPRFDIQTRGWTKGGQCSPHSRKFSSHTPPRRGITTRSGGPRSRTRLGVSLVSPRGMTMARSCLSPSSAYDWTAEPLASPGRALTAVSCSLMLCCPASVGFSVRLARTAMEQSGLTRWGVDKLAVLYTLHLGVPGRC